MDEVIQGRVLIPGEAVGEVLKSDEPLSFWGGYDQRSGEIIDRRHPLSGQIAADKLLALPATRGSSTTTAVLLEAVRNGKAPRAILTIGVDTFFALAAIVAEEMYGRSFPVIALSEQTFGELHPGDQLQVHPDGRLEKLENVI
jgi:predicted aconitase with swiveling domain